MIRRNQLCWVTTCLIGSLAVIGHADKASAQLANGQSFDGIAGPAPGQTVGPLFAVPPNPVTNWGLDGACSGANAFQDGNKGDNGSRCLRTLVPAGVGTRLIKDLNPGTGSSTIGGKASIFLDVMTRLFISADDGTGTNGQELYQVLNSLYPIMTLQADIAPGSVGSNPQNVFAHIPGAATNVYFSADDGTTGRELYLASTNLAMVTTTTLFKDINPTGSSNPGGFAVGPAPGGGVPAKLFFAADDGTNGREIWLTDGTAANTAMIKDINATPGVSSDPQLLTPVAFIANADIKVFFTADDGVNGRELWRSDGTLAGTGLCKDIIVGATGSTPTNLTAGNPLVTGVPTATLFFTVDSDGANGQELWKSRGALDGSDTVLVKDAGASPANLTNNGNTLFFTVGNDLWKSSGTTAGTVLVQSFTSLSGPLVALGTSVYFSADNGGGHGVELWKSDGTTTVEAKDINPGAGSSSPTGLTTLNGSVYFSADDGTNGRELWRSETTLGAVLIKNINPGAASSDPSNFIDLNGTVFFTANDGSHGTEPWQTDGIAGGVADHAGMDYKWDLVPVIQSHDAGKSAVVGLDTNVLTIFWMHDWSGLGATGSFNENAHQANFYVELTDGIDRAPLNIADVDCGDGNVTRPRAALTDGTDHKAIAFGMVSVLDQNPCDTDRLPGSPGVPVAATPAIYDGHDWIPMDMAHIPPGVPTDPPSAASLAQGPWSAIALNGTLPGSLIATPDDPWATKRFCQMRIDLWTDYMRVIIASKQSNFLYVATIPRKYKGGFKAFYMGNKGCVQQPFLYYTDSVNLNGGLLTTSVDPYGACCSQAGCSDVLSQASCPSPATFSAWKACSDSTYSCCAKPWADIDRDTDVDMDDFGRLQRCYDPIGAIAAGCKCLNHVAGAAIDDADVIEFAKCLPGPLDGNGHPYGPSASVPWSQAATPSCTPCPAPPMIAPGCP